MEAILVVAILMVSGTRAPPDRRYSQLASLNHVSVSDRRVRPCEPLALWANSRTVSTHVVRAYRADPTPKNPTSPHGMRPCTPLSTQFAPFPHSTTIANRIRTRLHQVTVGGGSFRARPIPEARVVPHTATRRQPAYGSWRLHP